MTYEDASKLVEMILAPGGLKPHGGRWVMIHNWLIDHPLVDDSMPNLAGAVEYQGDIGHISDVRDSLHTHFLGILGHTYS